MPLLQPMSAGLLLRRQLKKAQEAATAAAAAAEAADRTPEGVAAAGTPADVAPETPSGLHTAATADPSAAAAAALAPGDGAVAAGLATAAQQAAAAGRSNGGDAARVEYGTANDAREAGAAEQEIIDTNLQILFVFISAETRQGAVWSDAASDMVFEALELYAPDYVMTKFVQFSDNCCRQYKCSSSLWAAFRRALSNGLELSLNYFGPGHGKRVIDAVGGWWKREILTHKSLNHQVGVHAAALPLTFAPL